MRLRMRSYILLPFGVLLAVTVLGVTALNVELAGRRTRAQLESRLQNVMDTLATSNFPLTDSVLRQMRGLSGAEFAVADRTGQILGTSRDPIWISGALRSLAEAPPAADSGHQRIRWEGQDYVVSVVSLQRPAHGSEPLHILFPDRLFRDAWWSHRMSQLLVVDDEQSIGWGIRRVGERLGHRVQTAATAEDAMRQVEHFAPDLIVMDVRLPGIDGLTAAYVPAMLGQSAAMRAVFKDIALAAQSDVGVLLEGESGTGKELAARCFSTKWPKCHVPPRSNCSEHWSWARFCQSDPTRPFQLIFALSRPPIKI